MRDQTFFNWIATASAVVVMVAGLAGMVLAPGSGPTVRHTATTTYVNLTIALDRSSGLPRFSPANFTVGVGRVVITIFDRDLAASWAGCPCTVAGTEGGVEQVNGTPLSHLDPSNVAHTFTVGSLGLNVLSPGGSTVEFAFDVTGAGTYVWECLAPCGEGSDPYTGAPMGVAGYMSGTITVA